MLLAALLCRTAQAADAAPTGIGMPDLELLEFIGQWETDDGDWISPDQLQSGEFGQLLEAAASPSGQATPVTEPGGDDTTTDTSETTDNE